MARSRCRAVRDAGTGSLDGGRRGAVPSRDLRASPAAGGGRSRRADRRRRPCRGPRRGGRARRGRGGGRHDPPRRSRGRRERPAVPAGTAAGARRRHRHGLRGPDLPAAPRRAAGSADASVRVERHVPGLRRVRLPARARPHLGGDHPADRRRRTSASFATSMPSTPPVGRSPLSPSGRTRVSLHRRAASWSAVACSTSTGGSSVAPVSSPSATRWRPLRRPQAGGSPWRACRSVHSSSCSTAALTRPDRRPVRRMVRHVDPAVGRGPPRLRRRGGPAVAGTRPRPRSALDLGRHRRGGTGRSPDRASCCRLPRDDRAPGVARSRRGVGPRRVRDRLAPADGRGSDA